VDGVEQQVDQHLLDLGRVHGQLPDVVFEVRVDADPAVGDCGQDQAQGAQGDLREVGRTAP